MINGRSIDRGSALMVLVGQAAGAPPQIRSVRLYVFDCGVLKQASRRHTASRARRSGRRISPTPATSSPIRGHAALGRGHHPRRPGEGRWSEVQAANGTNTARTTLRSQLAAIGYSARDITYLALSHGHADHVANANEYAGSTLLLQKAEWNAMFGAEAQKLPLFAAYGALESSKTVLLEGDRDVFGDGTVVLKSTPGHTPGHQSCS
jgi:glyoxylase-like metal-dependent hydrolase (beta-lactamase superfamily II)